MCSFICYVLLYRTCKKSLLFDIQFFYNLYSHIFSLFQHAVAVIFSTLVLILCPRLAWPPANQSKWLCFSSLAASSSPLCLYPPAARNNSKIFGKFVISFLLNISWVKVTGNITAFLYLRKIGLLFNSFIILRSTTLLNMRGSCIPLKFEYLNDEK